MSHTEYDKLAEKDDFICLSDGKNKAWFEVLDYIVFEGNEYVALLQDEQTFVLRVLEPSGGKEERYAAVEDDITFQRVCEAFETELNFE